MTNTALRRIAATLGMIFLVAAAYYFLSRSPSGQINLLCYIGYDEAEFIEAFTAETGIRVNCKTYFGGDEMFSLLNQSKATYDVVVVDPEYLQKLVKQGRLQRLAPSDFSFGEYYQPFRHFAPCFVDDTLYGVVVRFGVNGLVYNRGKLPPDDVLSYQVIWSDKYSGKIGLVDWYLLSMGAVSKAMGHPQAYDLTPSQFDQLCQRLTGLKPRLAAIYSVPDLFKALASEEIWILPCGGESVVYNLPNRTQFDWTVPEEGGILWVETLTIPVDAPNTQGGVKFIKWAQTAKAQALLATRHAYASSVPNAAAYAHLSAEARAILKTDSPAAVDALLKKLSLRTLPVQQNPLDWQKAWERFKAE